MRIAAWWCLVMLGCAEPYSEPRVPSLPPAGDEPRLRVTFEDNLGFPYRLQELLVVLDGEPIYRERFSPQEMGRPIRLADLVGLREGEHTLRVRAVASYAATRIDADEGCDIDVRVSRTFHLSRRPANVHLDVYAKGNVTMPFAERLFARVRVHGARDVAADMAKRLATENPVCRDDAPLLPVEERPLFEERFTDPFGLEPRAFE